MIFLFTCVIVIQFLTTCDKKKVYPVSKLLDVHGAPEKTQTASKLIDEDLQYKYLPWNPLNGLVKFV